MPALGLFYIVLAVLCIVHAVQTGQDRFWIFVVLIFPFLGSIAYMAAVFIPMAISSNGAQKGVSSLRDKLNPQRYLDAAEQQLNMARTPENLFLYGEALANQGRFEDADVILKELAQNQAYAEYPKFLLLYARTHIWLKRYAQALEMLERYEEHSVSAIQGPALVLLSYAHEGLKEFDKAEAVYVNALDNTGGEELRYHYGEYLVRRGRLGEARNIFQQVLTRSAQMSRHYRSQEGEWIKRSREQLRLIAA